MDDMRLQTVRSFRIGGHFMLSMRWLAGLCAALAAATGLAYGLSPVLVPAAYAETSQSTNYRFEESVLGGGGLVQSSSPNYQADGAVLGDTAVDNSASANYQVNAGNKTTPDPTLTFSIDNANANFGNFSASATATATAVFSVSNYTSYGYAVQILGTPPSNGSHTVDAMASTDSPITGIEQFGINLVANTSPTSLGANPDHGQSGFGSATANYGTSNMYRYVSGETIATSPKSSGKTIYTISYIVNVESLTPGGQYTSQQTVICTGTF